MDMNFVSPTFENFKFDDNGNEYYIRIVKNDIDEEVTVFTSNHLGTTKVTWANEEAREIAKMLSVILKD